ncbi:RHO1 GDP-GTP exchange protein 2 [Tulasnella sp. 418]|nr:RHO1 GDP-GTP exchange protein 2 [Tulasnella sp. 418]
MTEKRQAAYESIFGRPKPPPEGAAPPVYPTNPYAATSYAPAPPTHYLQHPLQVTSPQIQYMGTPYNGTQELNGGGVIAPQPHTYHAIFLNTPHHQTAQRPISFPIDPNHPQYAPQHPLPQLPTVEIDRSGLGIPDYPEDTSEESELPWNRRTPSPNGSRHGWNSASSSISRNSRADGGPQRESDIAPFNPNLQHTPSPHQHNRRPSSPSASTISYPEYGHPSVSSGPSDYTSRRSTESTRTMPQSLTPSSAANRRSHMPSGDRSRSLSTSTPRAQSISDFNMTPTRSHHSTPQPRRSPIVYPALLSRVAEAFRSRIVLAERVKDGLAYQDAFDGREAVDKIAYIIRTTDRNLALLLGRALDAQKFFHDVTYDHRLRDSPYEIYQFRTRLPSPFVSEEMVTPTSVNGQSDTSSATMSPVSSRPSTTRPRRDSIDSTDDIPLPTGVFTLLADCYSPTCTRDMLCYSIACPRRLEQQARLNMKPQPGLRRSISQESLGDYVHHEAGTLWIHSVPQEVVDSVSDTEKKRQEAINEVIYTERDFVKDMEYLRDFWIKPLQASDIIPAHRRADFISQVFWNVHDIIAVNIRLRDALNKRQKSYAIVETIGDLFADVVPHFHPFVSYGSHQLYGKYEFEKEKGSNPAFAQFVDDTERLPESRKLELNGYLTKPTTRLARYPLLLDVVIKYTPEDNPDKMMLVDVVKEIREFLKRPIPLELLVVSAHEDVASSRPPTGRPRQTIIKRNSFSGREKDRDSTVSSKSLLPLSLTTSRTDTNPSSLSKAGNKRDLTVPNENPNPPNKHGYAITFMYLGKKGYVLTLWASTFIGRRKWLEAILKQQEVLRIRSLMFDTVTLSEGFFYGPNKVNCAVPFNQGTQIVYGTDNGVYFSDLTDRSKEPVHVLALLDVSQVDVIEEHELLIVLSERSVMTFPLDALDPNDPTAGLKRAKRVASHTSFFKAGTCLGKTLVCVVKASALSSTIKTLVPIEQGVRGKNKPTFRKLLQGGNDTLRVFREFYIPTESSSIHFLKTKLCVGCTKGFEIVDLETLDTQGLLDPADASLDFVQKREGVRPIAIYRIENEFLLCYDEFAFYVNRSGWRARPNWIVHWEGTPTSFALHYPFVLAFEPTFIEVRHVDSGQLIQVIPGNNLRCLFADTPPSLNAALNAGYARGNPYINPYARQPAVPTPQGPGTGYMHQPGAYGYQQFNAYSQQQMSGPPQLQVNPYYQPQPGHRSQVYARDEIIIVSEDRVMCVRLAPPPITPASSVTQIDSPTSSITSGMGRSSIGGSSTLVG